MYVTVPDKLMPYCATQLIVFIRLHIINACKGPSINLCPIALLNILSI